MASNPLEIDTANSKVSFSLKKLGFITVNGDLSDLRGTIHFDRNNPSNSSFDVTLSTSTIGTSNKQRDEHLRNEDFFSVKDHPTIIFKSTVISKEAGTYTAKGNLSVLETTKEVQIPFTFNDGIFKGHFSLNRLDYGLGKKFPSFVVGKTVQVSIYCETK